MIIPELLAPAGGAAQLEAAVRFGADAVYLGLKQFGLRAHAANFTWEELGEALGFAHSRGVKLLITLNMLVNDEEVACLAHAAARAQQMGVDGVIVSDPGAVAAVLERAPGLPIHLSTQASTMNAAACRFWHKLGVRRIVLARELSIDQIRYIRAHTPSGLELEAFVHGAVCMAHSGRCALSSHLAGRSANRGDCTQPCRWRYAVVEEKRPGVYFPVEEGEGFTQIFAARDLNMIEHLPELCAAGLDSLKIEGRMKNEYYVATVVGAYRRGLDALRWDPDSLAPGSALLQELRAELSKVGHRASDTGFYFGPPEHPGGAGGTSQTMEYAGRVLRYDGAAGRLLMEVHNRVLAGDAVELLSPEGARPMVLRGLCLEDGQPVEACAQPLARVWLDAPFPAQPGDLIRGTCRNHPRPE